MLAELQCLQTRRHRIRVSTGTRCRMRSNISTGKALHKVDRSSVSLRVCLHLDSIVAPSSVIVHNLSCVKGSKASNESVSILHGRGGAPKSPLRLLKRNSVQGSPGSLIVTILARLGLLIQSSIKILQRSRGIPQECLGYCTLI
ncbi:hypothetical protein Mapa_017573 [Marchantia paleacea]|nr:hypothetical protein Mapa_017573 [Marchantia paleacea]